MTASGCGSCTLCCTVMKVTAKTVKLARVPCEHCTEGGCAIYADRPDACSGFMCLWLATQDFPPARMPADLRPDRVGTVIDLNTVGVLIAHCETRRSWTREPMLGWLLRMATRTTVMLDLPNGTHLLAPDGSTEALVPVGVDPATKQRLYVRASEQRAAS